MAVTVTADNYIIKIPTVISETLFMPEDHSTRTNEYEFFLGKDLVEYIFYLYLPNYILNVCINVS